MAWLVVAMLGAVPALAQDPGHTVAGTVTESIDGSPLPGVNVRVKGTTIGEATSVDGAYQLTAPSPTDTLVFSFIGYATQEVPILGRAVVDVELVPRTYEGGEVVVIGYGTSAVRDLTGSVGTVSAERIEGRPLRSFEEALQGQVAGVQVQQNGGDLIGNFSVNIRGVGSYNGSNRPLYVVDGIPLEPTDIAFLATLNTEDIESISVLKDASSASIYGTRAADGVVLITTKAGRGQEPQIQFSTEFGASDPINTVEVLGPEEMRDFLVDSRTNANPNYTLPSLLEDPAFLNAYATDWQDELLRTGTAQRYDVRAQGGTGRLRFAASANYENIEGTLIETFVERASLRLNTVAELSERATLDVRLNGARQWGNVAVADQTFNGNWLRYALYKLPWERPYNPDGTFAEYPLDGDFAGVNSGAFAENPVASIIENRRDRQWMQFLGNVKLTYRLPYNLTYEGAASTNVSLNTADDFFPVTTRVRQQRETVRVLSNDQTGFNYFTDHVVRYTPTIGRHSIEALLGGSYQLNYREFTFVDAGGSINSAQNQINQQPEVFDANGGRGRDQVLASAFGRVDYDYDGRYFVTGTVRRDGASNFAEGNRWAIFPAIGLAWRLSDESFLQDADAIDDLKLRASYGELGDRSGLNDNPTLNTVGAGGTVAFGDDAVAQAPPTNIGQQDLVWETVRQLDVGVDLSLYRGRFALTADYYYRRTDDILGFVPGPPELGLGGVFANLGSVKNVGVELGFNTVPLDVESGLQWRVDLTFGYNRNEVLDLGEDVLGEGQELFGRPLDGPLVGGAVNRTVVGRPIGEFWVWTFDGICQEDQYDAAAGACNGIQGLQPGDALFVDLDGDGDIDADDRSFHGSGLPKYFGGLTNGLRYGPLSLDAIFTYAVGRKLLDTSRMFGLAGDSNINKRAEVLDRWTPENTDTDIPRAVQGRQGYRNVRASTFFLEDASFVRLRTLTLGYDLPARFALGLGVQNARLAFTGTNLFTLTGYGGFDPEASSGRKTGSGNLDAAANPLSPGLDFTTYPLARTYSVRFSVTL